jgi:hypothetical protein
MKTTFPQASPKINEWLRYISIPQLNLNLIDDSMLGQSIKMGYKEDPYNTIIMIQQSYQDNPILTEEVVSSYNLKLCIKCNPLEPLPSLSS